MRDYVEQVKELRDFAEEFDLEDHTETAIMLANAADAIEELQAKVPRWISVEERLPEKHKTVLFYIPWNKTNMIGWIDEGGGINLEGYGKCYDFSLIKPSHWMPPPEAPKEAE